MKILLIGEYNSSHYTLKEGLEKVGTGRDQLLFLLDLGLSLHCEKKYKEVRKIKEKSIC